VVVVVVIDDEGPVPVPCFFPPTTAKSGVETLCINLGGRFLAGLEEVELPAEAVVDTELDLIFLVVLDPLSLSGE
jgi:hypothetical protein